MNNTNSASAQSFAFTIYPISEKAVTVEFGNIISVELMQAIAQFDQLLQANPFPGFITKVPAYCTLTVFFDALVVAKADMPGSTSLQKVSSYLQQLRQTNSEYTPAESDIITIPVCYGGSFGPDLDEVTTINNLTPVDVIRIHTSVTYLVHMIGFVPGFAYLGGMPQTISAPRKATPRPAIPAGSVGIAGLQTGIYPLQTPGGWQIIGQTPLTMFDASRQAPSLLKAGDKVQFQSITSEEFDHQKNNLYAAADC